MTGSLSLRQCVVLPLLVLILSACSAAEQKRFEYRNSQAIEPLQLPDGLQAPRSEAMLQLPRVNSEAVEVDVRPPVNLPEELLLKPETPKRIDSVDDDSD